MNIDDTTEPHWRDHLEAILARMPTGAWATMSDLAEALGASPKLVGGHIAAILPDGHERLLSRTGTLRLTRMHHGLDRTQTRQGRIEQLAALGIHLDEDGRADPAARMSPADLAALAGDVPTGIAPDGIEHRWIESAEPLNARALQRSRLTLLAQECQWRTVADNQGWLEHLSNAATVIEHLPSRLIAAVGRHRQREFWATKELIAAGLADPDATATRLPVEAAALRSLEANRAVEVHLLATEHAAVPVLIRTLPLAPAPETADASSACRRGRHGECPGAAPKCGCGCGCSRKGRATTFRYLALGDEFSTSYYRRSTATAAPEPDPHRPGWVDITARYFRSGAVGPTGFRADWIATIHNPRRRQRH